MAGRASSSTRSKGRGEGRKPAAGQGPSKPRVEHHHSAGGLVMRAREILLISTREGKRWQLPKGHLEHGESAEQAAVRETREETGVAGRLMAQLPRVEYWFAERGARIHKRVDYFLLEYQSGDPADYDRSEVSGAAWFTWEEGIRRLSFANEKKVVEAAQRLATEKGGS